MAGIFSKIASGEIPSYKIAEDENFYAFLDIAPVAKGHTLVIPKKEIDYLFDIDDELYSGLQLFAKKVAIALKKAIPCQKVGVVVLGLEVPHAHIHLLPMQSEQDVNFAKPKLQLSKEEFCEIQNKIVKAFNS
ncbi:MAG: HIT family protein [Bacteroidota bacterium]|nr:HIT family protein [Bacteroidota bacterium]